MKHDLYTVPMIGAAYVARELKVSKRHAIRLIKAHGQSVTNGHMWLVPARCLHELKPKKKRGRPPYKHLLKR